MIFLKSFPSRFRMCTRKDNFCIFSLCSSSVCKLHLFCFSCQLLSGVLGRCEYLPGAVRTSCCLVRWFIDRHPARIFGAKRSEIHALAVIYLCMLTFDPEIPYNRKSENTGFMPSPVSQCLHDNLPSIRSS